LRATPINFSSITGAVGRPEVYIRFKLRQVAAAAIVCERKKQILRRWLRMTP
jgi:hypothetical protein